MDSPAGPLPPDQDLPGETAAVTAPDRRAIIVRGIAWNSAFQVFLVAVNFVSMLVLVRVLTPAEYGRATAATGVLALINCFNCSAFIAQALQLPEGHEPDWAAHWQAGSYIQLGLALGCNLVAGIAWLLPAYRPIAPLLCVASLGLLIDVPSQLANARLRRAMDFRALRLTHAVATVVTVVSSVALALVGAGAYALIIGSNVLHGIPFGLYLLLVERWRPESGWWRWPQWRQYRPALQFGAQQSGTAMLAAARGMLESVVLPPAIGYNALGLLNRAQVLFTTTVGRVAMLVTETVYPLLPRSAADPKQFARHATLFVQTMLLVSIPGAIFVGIEGSELSRLLYGQKWVAADPLIWPGTLFAWGVATVLLFATVLQAQNRLRTAFTSNAIAAALFVPALIVALLQRTALSYAWAVAIGSVTAAVIAMSMARRSLRADWFRHAVVPPVVTAAIAATFAIVFRRLAFTAVPPRWRAVAEMAVFGLFAGLSMRLLFADALREVVARLPARQKLLSLLALR